MKKYDPEIMIREAFERIKQVLPLKKRINSGDVKQMFNLSQTRNMQMIGSAFQMVFTINKLLSNFRIKNLNFAIKVSFIDKIFTFFY